ERSGGNIGTLQSILVQSTHCLVDADDPHAETLTVELMAEARRDIRAEAAEQLAARAHAAGIARGKSKRKKSSDALGSARVGASGVSSVTARAQLRSPTGPTHRAWQWCPVEHGTGSGAIEDGRCSAGHADLDD